MTTAKPGRARSRAAALAAAALLAATAAACGSDAETTAPDAAQAAPAAGSYVGRVEGSDAYVALISDGKRVTGYLCDGKRVSRWLKPSAVRDGAAALIARDGERLGRASVAGGALRGELEIDATTHAFKAVAARGPAGPYRAAVERGGRLRAEAGWIVLADASQRGAVNQFVGKTIDLIAAPRLDPARPTATITDGTSNTRVTATKLATGFVEKTVEL